MAWASKKQYAIMMNSEEGQDLIEELPELTQDEFQKRFGEFLRKTGQSFINENEQEISKLEEELKNTHGIFNKSKLKKRIEALKMGYDSVDEYLEDKSKESERRFLIAEQERLEKQKAKEEQERKKKEQLENDIKTATDTQRKQFEIIQQTNPMLDDYHVGIRSPKDIKTFEEVVNDDESFAWGDFTKEDAKRSLKSGTITIYSSYPIKQGVFVSTSKIQAQQYAGGFGKKVYSKKIPLDEVAWINGDEGQYAKID